MWRDLQAGYISHNTHAVGGGKHPAYSEGFSGAMKDDKCALKNNKKKSLSDINPAREFVTGVATALFSEV